MISGRSNRIVGASTKAQIVRTYLEKRVCAAESCCTVLSIYNQAQFCSVHESPMRRSDLLFRR